jgi:hypothetical protein
MRADAADTCRKRHFFFYKLKRFFVFAVSYQPYIALAIGFSRTFKQTRRAAVAVVVAKKQLQRRLAVFADTLRIRFYEHTVHSVCGA